MGSFGSEEELLDYAQDSLQDFQSNVKPIWSEYLESGEVLVCVNRILDLECEAYDDELFVMAVNKTLDSANDLAATLLQNFLRTYYGNEDEESSRPRKNNTERKLASYIRGLEKLLTSWESISVDVPHALPFLVQLIFWSVENHFANKSFLYRMPEKLVAALPEGELKASLEESLKNLAPFKTESRKALKEYFLNSNSIDEVKQFLAEQDLPQFHLEFVRLVMQLGIQEHVNSKQDIDNGINLLGDLLDQNVIQDDDLNWGLLRFLGSAEDMQIDNPKFQPKASELIGQLLSNDLISSAFVHRCRLLRIGGAVGLEILTKVGRDFPEHYRKAARGRDFKREVRIMLLEFYDSKDAGETKRILQELSMTEAMRAEFVRKVIYFGLESSVEDGEEGMKLLSFLMKHEELKEEDVKRGFEELEAMLPDLKLDLPQLGEQYQFLRDSFQLIEE